MPMNVSKRPPLLSQKQLLPRMAGLKLFETQALVSQVEMVGTE